MDNKDLKGLSEAYNEVYYDNLEQLSEAPFGLNPLDYLPGNSPSAVRQRQQWAKEGETQRARERVTRATQQRADLNVVKTSKGYIAKPGGTSYDNEKAAQAVTLANRLNRETGLGKPPTPTKPVERKPPTTAPAASRPTPRPATPAPQPVQSTRTQRPSTGLSAPASSPRPTAAPAPRPAAATPSVASSPRPTAAPAPRPAAPSSLSTGGRRSNSELEGKTFATRATSGGTKYEVRTPTSAELAAARKEGGGEKGVQAAVARSSNLMSGPTATPIAAAVKPATPTPQKRNQAPSRAPITQMNSYNFGKPDHITQDVASLYKSIYEGKKKIDQDKDGDNDFADVQIAKMIASGEYTKKEAIEAVRNKSYNKKTELGEAAVRVPKKVRGAKDAKAYMAGRSDAGKRISGDEKQGPASYTSRWYSKSPVTPPGEKPQHTPRATKTDLNYARYVYNSSKKNPNRFGGPKGLPEDFELWVNDLLDEGYNLSEYTVDEMYEIFEETELDEGRTEDLKRKYTAKYGKLEYPTDTLRLNKTRKAYEKAATTHQSGYGPNPRTAIKGKQNLGQAMYKAGQSARVINAEFELWVNELLDEGYDLSEYTVDEIYEIFEETELERKKAEEERKNERRARVAEMQAQGRVMTPAKRAAAQRAAKAAEKREAALEKAASAALNDIRGATGRVSEKPMGSEAPESKKAAPEATRRLRTGLKRDTLGSAADAALKAIRKEEYDAFDVVLEYLLDEGYADDCDSADMMIERMSDEWLEEILESKKWIQKAIKKPGSLSKQLGVPEEKNIPSKMLSAAAKKGGKLGRRARLAKTLSKFH
jgi:hypothetical protein